MVRFALPRIAVACWTGAEPAPIAQPTPAAPRAHARPLALEVTLERTSCFGFCPEYTVTIHGDGVVEWNGVANVAVIGSRTAHATHQQLVMLDRALAAGSFFTLDDSGQVLAQQGGCSTSGNVTTCTFRSVTVCSDTSHSIVTVRRNGAVHRVDDAHCEDPGPLDAVEALIDRIANDAAWIGR